MRFSTVSFNHVQVERSAWTSPTGTIASRRSECSLKCFNERTSSRNNTLIFWKRHFRLSRLVQGEIVEERGEYITVIIRSIGSRSLQPWTSTPLIGPSSSSLAPSFAYVPAWRFVSFLHMSIYPTQISIRRGLSINRLTAGKRPW